MQQRDGERANERERERERDRKQQQRDVLAVRPIDALLRDACLPRHCARSIIKLVVVVIVVQYLWCIGGHSFGWREIDAREIFVFERESVDIQSVETSS